MADIQSLPVSSSKLEDIRKEQHSDSICSTVINYCHNGWPSKDKVENTIVSYWNKQGELSVCDGILLLGKRIVIPKSLHCQTLEKIHEGHQGISRCCSRAQAAVWWQQCIVNAVKQCVTCIKKSPPAREPLITTTLPSYPWQRVAVHLQKYELSVGGRLFFSLPSSNQIG